MIFTKFDDQKIYLVSDEKPHHCATMEKFNELGKYWRNLSHLTLAGITSMAN